MIPVSCTTPSRWKENGVFAQRFSRCIFGASSLTEFTAKEEQILHFAACCGEYKPSHLHEHPNLKVIGAPNVHFNQSDGKDLCVSKSLASALYSIGFTKEAVEVDSFGEEIMEGAVVNALEKVVFHARTVLPSWIVIQSIKKRFDWRKELNEQQILVGVLHASDGSCCHAVTIHGGFIYDANESIALPSLR